MPAPAARRTEPFVPPSSEELRQRYVGKRRAATRVDDPSTYVSPVNRRIAVSFRPGQATPIVHAAAGYQATATAGTDAGGRQGTWVTWSANDTAFLAGVSGVGLDALLV